MSTAGGESCPHPDRRGFGSDNHAAIHPEVMAALAAADDGHAEAYGADRITARLGEVVRDLFGATAEIYPVLNGTGANVVGLRALTRSWDAVICTDVAHIHVDECGAPEAVGGMKLLAVSAPDGRLTPQLVDTQAHSWGDPHRVQPRVVSVTQASELGTVYRPDQLRTLADHAHRLGMSVHMDGARLSNAAAGLGVPLAALTSDVGVDVLSLGGTKNGAMLAEAVVVLDPSREGLEFLRKSSMQLASKMRYVSAQLLALFEGDLWLRNASHANSMAGRLAEGLAGVEGVEIVQPVEANGVFASMPRPMIEALRERYRFHLWDDSRGLVRLMCSWDTDEADVADFLEAARSVGMP